METRAKTPSIDVLDLQESVRALGVEPAFDGDTLRFRMRVAGSHAGAFAIVALLDAALRAEASRIVHARGREACDADFKVDHFAPVRPGQTLIATTRVQFEGTLSIILNAAIEVVETGEVAARASSTFYMWLPEVQAA